MISIIKDYEKLKIVSEKVESVEEAKEIIFKLEETLRNHNDGYGLSAIQIGIPKRIAVIKYGRNNMEFIRLINPEFMEKEGEFDFEGEGCLSFPNSFVKTKRTRDYMIKNYVVDGNDFREEHLCFYYPGDEDTSPNKLESIAVEHEMDHMDGRTILDYGKPISKLIPIIRSQIKVGRNEPCPCGSKDKNGKIIKYKKCCGMN